MALSSAKVSMAARGASGRLASAAAMTARTRTASSRTRPDRMATVRSRSSASAGAGQAGQRTAQLAREQQPDAFVRIAGKAVLPDRRRARVQRQGRTHGHRTVGNQPG